ncbi:ABC transporter family substrate-binding protein [Modestobacter roseus]|uniref:Peptide/nickel transport system substrate-binding protein n=1 Tax=Modestobacter roseus TaxID=1181884 RepID=A0A562IL72_9ACTN|nr:ABC transporter family substrate-binding protein [Modestobacter roseus]TWH71690.1 peptide/nickel transport system substrate-binding protein [Modestobacter roseus]
MKLSKRSGALVAAGVTGAMVLSACGGSSDSGGGGGESGNGRVVYGEATDFPENLYPFIAAGNATSTQTVIGRVLPSAFNVNADFDVTWDENVLAEEPTLDTSGGQQVNVYTINDDAVWSDGTPISADDFEFTWRANRSADPADGGCETVLSTNGYANIESVEGSDDGKTVTVTYAEPYADWQSLFSTFLPAHLMDSEDDAERCATTTEGWPTASGLPEDISAGPWQVVSDNIDTGNQVIVLTPNPEWWGDAPGLSQLVIQNIGNDPTTAVQGLQNQELGVIYPQPQLDLVNQVEDLAPNVQSEITFGLSFEHLDFNASDVHLADPNVRKAFAMALDREEIVAQTVGQFSSDAQVLNNRLYVNNQPQYQDNAPEEYKSANPDMARQLLEESGYSQGPDGIYTHPERGRLAIQINTTANNPLRQTTIEVMIPQLEDAGIDATFNADPDIFAGADRPTSLEAGGFQAALFAWVSTPFVSSNQSIYYSPDNGLGQNYSRTGTPEIDQLLAEMVSTPDPDAAADLANQVDTALWDQMATLPLYQKPTFIAYQSDIQNVEDNASQAGPLWNSEEWTLAE